MPTPAPTLEEIEAARQLVDTADAAANAARKAEVLTKLQPLTDAGLGDDDASVNLRELITVLRNNYGALAAIDNNLPNLAFSTAQVLETLNDRIRSLVALNAPAAAAV